MDKKNDLLQTRFLNFRKAFVTALVFIFMAAGSGCGTETDLSECPDTSFSQTNLDTLEAQNPQFVWRVCNADEGHAMKEINTMGNHLDFRELPACACSNYISSESALGGINFNLNHARYSHAYLDHSVATKGLVDSVEIRNAPGRYTYFFSFEFPDRDTTNNGVFLKEIERESRY
jgi:hypothetical protein